MKILFLSRWFPYPPNNGSKIRIFNILRGLAKKHELTLVSFTGQEAVDVEAPALREICRDIHIVPWQPYNPKSARALLGFFSLKPRSVVDTESPAMRQQIEQLLQREKYDLVIATEFGMAGYVRYFQGVPALFECLELGVFYTMFHEQSSTLHRVRNGLTWYKQARYTANLLKQFNACTVASEPELALLKTIAPFFKNAQVIPNCVSLEDYRDIQAQPQPETLIFAGSFGYYANYEAMDWFLREVYPLVQVEVPNVQLSITGDPAGRSLPPTRGVLQTGHVKDVRPLMASAWASLVPIKTGGGTRLKIIESMALRTPVISTSKGAEGIEYCNGQDILIADTPEDFAKAVVRLLRDPQLHKTLSENAYNLVRQKYDWGIVLPRLSQMVEQSASANNARNV
jgi:polysaccharide biosynthesis protein PslH